LIHVVAIVVVVVVVVVVVLSIDKYQTSFLVLVQILFDSTLKKASHGVQCSPFTQSVLF
jgi:hypothetical protein